MKKLFTFLMILAASAIVYGQGIIISDEMVFADFEGEPEDFGYEVVSAAGHSEHGLVDNPAKSDLNDTDKAYKGVREEGSWNANVTMEWEIPVLTEGRNFMSIMVYSEGHNAFVYLKVYNDGAVVREGWAAGATPAQSNGQWAKAVLSIGSVTQFDKLEIFLSNNWGGNQADQVAYFDELGMYKETYEFQGPFMDMVITAEKVDEEMDIDGLDLEDIWIDAEFGEVNKINQGDGTGIAGKFAAAWDEEYLYMFFEVDDNVIWKWSDANWAFWKGDGFQVYMDALGRRIDGRVFGNMNGVGIAPDLESQGAIDANQSFRNMLPFGDHRPDAKQGSIISGTGYTIEVAWPWKGIALAAGADLGDVDAWVAANVKPGLEIAFDVQLNDDDGAGRINMLSWASEPKEPHSNSGTWGALRLGGDNTSVSRVGIENDLRVYPSLTTNYINIRMQNLSQFEIYDLTGRLMHSVKADNDNVRFEVSDLKAGIYILRANNGTGNAVQKFIKR
jgi:hypothetical protein